MSLSNERQSNWGTIFMGPGPSMETTLERVEAGGPSLAWTADTEAEYLARVREKATAKAKEILAAAQAEAQALREQAHAQGYEAGLDQAQAELEEFRQGMGASVDAVLGAIESNVGHVTTAWRKELVGLTRLCVETAVNHELSEKRAALLAGLFDGATAKMEAAQRITILVNPEDEPAVADMLDAAGRSEDRIFTVRGDASLEPGSLVLESDDSRVDNSLTVRRALVENILAQLTLPEDTPEETRSVASEAEAPLAAEPTFMPEAADLAQDHAVVPEALLETAPLETSDPVEVGSAAQAASELAEEITPEVSAVEPQAAPEEVLSSEVVLEEQILPAAVVEQAAPEFAPAPAEVLSAMLEEIAQGATFESGEDPEEISVAPAAMVEEEHVAEDSAPVASAPEEPAAEGLTSENPAEDAAVAPELDPFESAQAALGKEQTQS